MKPRPSVDSIMSTPLYSVGDDTCVEEANKVMLSYGVKKILVKDTNNNPIGVLESWKISPRDFSKKVKDIPLGPFRLVPEGTDIGTVEKALYSASAVYVHEKNNVNNIIGVVTSYDLYKSL